MQSRSPKKKIKFIYILSQRYSGSTLLSFLLATHPDVATVGERRKFYNKVLKSHEFPHHRAKICSCGELFAECQFLNNINKRVIAKVPKSTWRRNATEFKMSNNRYIHRIADECLKLLLKNGQSIRLFPWRKKIDEMADFNVQLVQEILAEGNARFF